jgi:Tfp pilus assembly protein PilV
VLTVGALITRVRRRLTAEDGFTLSEVLIASVLGLLVVGTGAMIFTVAIRSQPTQSSRSESIRTGRTMTERLVRELRQGKTVSSDASNHTTLSYETKVTGSTVCVGGPGDDSEAKPCLVTYSCAGGACNRQETDPYTGASGPQIRAISGLATNEVFSSISDPTVECPVPAVGDEGVTITDSATLRNSGDDPGRVCVALIFPS